METKKLIGLRVRELRRAKNMSQETLAEKVGISSKYISSIERGKENPTLDTLIGLSKSLNVDILELFNFSHEGKSKKDLKEFILNQVKGSDEERLKITAKIVKALYV